MELDLVELFALERLFGQAGAEPRCLAGARHSFEVLERSKTSLGFYSIIKYPHGLEQIQPRQELSLPFRHHLLPSGGHFVCWVEGDSTLCLEAVASQQPWPADFTPAGL
ncbi:hypothetical protein P8H27_09410 [Pseudomonas sp. sp1636]|uniref:hypothetical protein n=1 Tax=Pseudomonas sp. sp1636 TaxID=3036707 RepID=UPI0025A50793|nr:hypothetical protein [Pseudomonas sp. sp1636]MDM8349121.1 hypothetical protein [Pseudomonas sp. sp1636]